MENHSRRCPEIRECTNSDCSTVITFRGCVSCLEGRNLGCSKLAGQKVTFNVIGEKCHLMTCTMPMVTKRFERHEKPWQPPKEMTHYHMSAAADQAHYRAVKANKTLGDFA